MMFLSTISLTCNLGPTKIADDRSKLRMSGIMSNCSANCAITLKPPILTSPVRYFIINWIKVLFVYMNCC